MFARRCASDALRTSKPFGHRTWNRATSVQLSCTSFRNAIKTIDICPSPSCECRPTPPNLAIDRVTQISSSTPFYRNHIVVCTGRNDWASRIQFDTASGDTTPLLKELFSPGRHLDAALEETSFYDPSNPVLITNGSFQSTITPVDEGGNILEPTSVYLFPSFKYLNIPPVPYGESQVPLLKQLGKGFILTGTPLEQRGKLHLANAMDLEPDLSQRKVFQYHSDVNHVVVLICGHGGRDTRCGVIGPPIQAEFEDRLPGFSIDVLPRQLPLQVNPAARSAHIGLTSHIGGHKWAGNIIIYIPPSWQDVANSMKSPHPLAGKGIWYGRVEPRHVEGIIEETIIKGVIIEELFRGGIDQNGQELFVEFPSKRPSSS